MGGSDGGLIVSARVIFLLGFIWFLVVGLLADGARKGATTITITPAKNMEHSMLLRKQQAASFQDMDLNFVSKRRVPNGADPIHNRRAGKSKLPPDGV